MAIKIHSFCRHFRPGTPTSLRGLSTISTRLDLSTNMSTEEWLRKVHEGPCCADPKDKDLDENRCGGLHRSKA